ncbi:MAG TPA: magnesium transporter CorA family protein [Gaiellaceae bacterium]|nr:magnesium transporter CorA family protein [Gaiellaceae bacterium]
MSATLVERDGDAVEPADRAAIEEQLRSGEFFWLDIQEPDRSDFEILRETFEFHPLAVEDSEHFGQRAKLDTYGDYVFLVVYGWSPDDDGLVEVHCFYSERFLVTVHRDEAPALEELRRSCTNHHIDVRNPALTLHRVVDSLVDSFFPVLEGFDVELDELEDEFFRDPGDEPLRKLFTMKRKLATLRRAIAPERDLFAFLDDGAIPGLDTESARYFRDVSDHLYRLAETIDSFHELTLSAMDVFLSSSSNRMNEVMKQLTIIATIFLPLSYIAGFFGQNFDFLVDHVGSATAFILGGVLLQLGTFIFLFVYFRRKHWV